MRATQAIIHLDVFKKNIETLRAHHRANGAEPSICVPVKADAYGHGAIPAAKAALEAGARHLAVATVDEGAQLRDAGIRAPILLLSQCVPAEMEAVWAYSLTPLVSDTQAAALFAEAGKQTALGAIYGEVPPKVTEKLPVFIKIDTGMGRVGCRPEDAPALAGFIEQTNALKIAGIITHFAVSDSSKEENIAYTNTQIERFSAVAETLKARGIQTGILSAANSGGSVSHPKSWFDMVRPGIILYGYQDAGSLPALKFKPVMELVTQIVFTKTVRKGESVSYGRTWTADADTVIGVLPLGYADGLPRLLSGNFSVCINGVLYPLAGRICMDQCMVNLGAHPEVERWDKVTIFGGAKPALNAADIAERIGTIPYEITCGISKRVPRVYAD